MSSNHFLMALRHTAQSEQERQAVAAAEAAEVNLPTGKAAVIDTAYAHTARARELMKLEGFCATVFNFQVDEQGREVGWVCRLLAGHTGDHYAPENEV